MSLCYLCRVGYLAIGAAAYFVLDGLSLPSFTSQAAAAEDKFNKTEDNG